MKISLGRNQSEEVYMLSNLALNSFCIDEGDYRIMINFEEELKNFKPSLEVEEAEQAIYNHELVDMTDMMQEMLREIKQGM